MSKNLAYIELTELEHFLKLWGAWCVSVQDNGLGYPSASAFSRLKERVALIPYTPGEPGVIPIDEWAERIEASVAQLYQVAPEEARALRACYTGTGRLRDRARQLGISYGQFRYRVDAAKFWLLGALTVSVQRTASLGRPVQKSCQST